MLRDVWQRLLLPSPTGMTSYMSQWPRYMSSRSITSIFRDEASLDAARQWLTTLRVESIPRNRCIISFSRSSGPGGQSVNKVNSKATVHLPLSVLLPLVPNALHQQMRDSRFYSNRFEAITVQADGSRKQADNVDECFRKLYDVIAEVGRAAIPGLTSATQKARVQQLQNADRYRRQREKKMQSAKKSSRRSSTRSDY